MRTSRRMRQGIAAVVVAAAASAGGCDDAAAPPDFVLPEQLLLIGEAEGTAPDGRSIQCFLDIVLDVQERDRTDGEATYSGTHGGHVGRALLDDEGAGFVLDAFVGGDARVHIRSPGDLEVVFPANEDVDSRFWAGLHTLQGSYTTTPVTAEGDWTCAPLDITEGYVDTEGTVTGRWRLDVPMD